MSVPAWFERLFTGLADCCFARLPRGVPTEERLTAARIVSHRGEHDNRRILENTLAAFDRADAAGVWGLEFDVRWTADRQPVVCHDADLRRMAGSPLRLAETSLAELRSVFAPLPTLGEVVARYGGRRHLMIEIKAEPYPAPHFQRILLSDILAALEPVADYHLLSLDPDMFRHVGFAPRRALLPVAWSDVGGFSRLAMERGYGGINGHFLLVGGRHLRRHHARGQGVGVGMVASSRCLHREIRRGVDWIFSDHAAALTRICARRLSA